MSKVMDAFAGEREALASMATAHRSKDFAALKSAVEELWGHRSAKIEAVKEAGHVGSGNDLIDSGTSVTTGAYLVEPPRVGVDGRTIRETGDTHGVAVVVVTREPETRTGLWPLVAIGSVTFRTKIEIPELDEDALPGLEWFLEATEALGSAAVEEVGKTLAPVVRVDELIDRVISHPYSETLHKALITACMDAEKDPTDPRRSARRMFEDDE